jgi:hypothetical protein
MYWYTFQHIVTSTCCNTYRLLALEGHSTRDLALAVFVRDALRESFLLLY